MVCQNKTRYEAEHSWCEQSGRTWWKCGVSGQHAKRDSGQSADWPSQVYMSPDVNALCTAICRRWDLNADPVNRRKAGSRARPPPSHPSPKGLGTISAKTSCLWPSSSSRAFSGNARPSVVRPAGSPSLLAWRSPSEAVRAGSA